MCFVNKRFLCICNTKEKITSIKSVCVSVCVCERDEVTMTSAQLPQQTGLQSPV